MDARAMRERVTLRTLTRDAAGWHWADGGTLWAAVQYGKGRALFSSIGLGGESVQLTLRRMPLTLDHALRWRGQHLFLTRIDPTDPLFFTVDAAIVHPVDCVYRREGVTGMDEYRRPTLGQTESVVFPGCLTERYVRQTQDEPHTTTDTTLVLVTPKVITLPDRSLVTVDGVPYEVQFGHRLDAHKNEYEILRREDA